MNDAYTRAHRAKTLTTESEKNSSTLLTRPNTSKMHTYIDQL